VNKACYINFTSYNGWVFTKLVNVSLFFHIFSFLGRALD